MTKRVLAVVSRTPLNEPLDYRDIRFALQQPAVREGLGRASFLWFCQIYLASNFPLDFAEFHRNIFDSLMGPDMFVAMIGFRGSAKSTIMEAFAIWNLVTGRSEFTVYIGATSEDAKMSVANIRDEIEGNDLLIKDFNLNLEHKKKFYTDKWSDGQITIGNATILARSRGQRVRGAKFKKARIDLIIVDDLENVEDAESIEKRSKTRKWFFTEVIPATKQGVLANDVKVAMIGNLVHQDCLLAHMEKSKIVNVQRFAILDEYGKPSWPALYPDMNAIEAQKQTVMLADDGMGSIIWAREYLLKIIEEDEQPIKASDIHYYEPAMLQRKKLRGGVGMDFAISKKQTADYTTMIKAVEVENEFGERRILILPNPIRKRMGFEETLETAVLVDSEMPMNTTWYPEKVGYQQAAIEMLEKKGIRCEPIVPLNDKRARLMVASPAIKSGMVMFPKEGAGVILAEVLGFGIEAHDDAMDGLVNVVIGMTKKRRAVVV